MAWGVRNLISTQASAWTLQRWTMLATLDEMPACDGWRVSSPTLRRRRDVQKLNGRRAPYDVSPPVLPHAVARRLGPGLGPLERVGVGGPLLLLLLLPLDAFSNRVDVDAPSSLQLLQFHLAAVLVPVGLAQQSAALLAPQGTDSRPHDEGRHLGEALEGDAAALAALLLAELLELVIGHER